MNTIVRLTFVSAHAITIMQALARVPVWIFVIAVVPGLANQVVLVWTGR